MTELEKGKNISVFITKKMFKSLNYLVKRKLIASKSEFGRECLQKGIEQLMGNKNIDNIVIKTDHKCQSEKVEARRYFKWLKYTENVSEIARFNDTLVSRVKELLLKYYNIEI